MKTRIIRIGKSQGVRIPKLYLEQSRLGEEVVLEVKNNKIVIRSARPRHGWAEAAKAMAARREAELLDEGFSHGSWDEEEWVWEAIDEEDPANPD